MAEQQHPVRRKVALKVIKPGMDTKQVVARFEAERQALAMMDHTHIARVLDGGATGSGRPYFVMELVRGIPITEFCDGNQLTPHARLGLFVTVCQAVQHAHQRGIIHRDLKPTNVLVTLQDEGTPLVKVIDFGIAKALGPERLTDKTLFTDFALMIGTPLYMSPEQAEMNGQDTDTRTDIYALGVLLYELLTGTTPFDKERLKEASYEEIRRILREEEPAKPSTRISTLGQAGTTASANRKSEPKRLSQLFRRELDWIVMKTLEKDRNHRYETVGSFAADVQRYLNDEPVQACPPSPRYRLRKFARKHKKLLATASAFVALLLVGVVATAWQAVRATEAEGAAVAERDEKEQARQAEAEQRAAAVLNEQVAQQERDEAQRQRDEVRALNDRLQRTLYAAHMNLAKSAWDTGLIGRVNELLERHRPKPGESDLRDFEWRYLYRLCHSELLTLKGHTSGVTSVAFSPDGKRLASGSGGTWDGTKRAYVGGEVKVWDAQTGQELHTFHGRANCVAFSPDGRRLANATGGEVKVWDAQTGKVLLTLKGGGESVAYSPDGKRLASTDWDDGADSATVKVWDAQTGLKLLTLQGLTGGLFTTVAFSPEGKRLASTSSDNTVKMWDAQTGQQLLSLKGAGDNLAFSPDGHRLASNGPDGAVSIWDATPLPEKP
jgi:hypothetical protein